MTFSEYVLIKRPVRTAVLRGSAYVRSFGMPVQYAVGVQRSGLAVISSDWRAKVVVQRSPFPHIGKGRRWGFRPRDPESSEIAFLLQREIVPTTITFDRCSNMRKKIQFHFPRALVGHQRYFSRDVPSNPPFYLPGSALPGPSGASSGRHRIQEMNLWTLHGQFVGGF